MYQRTGITQADVKVSDLRIAIEKRQAQLEFNSPNRKVVIHLHSSSDGGESARDAAQIRNDSRARVNDEGILDDFRTTTKKRIAQYRRMNENVNPLSFSGISSGVSPMRQEGNVRQSDDANEVVQSAIKKARQRLARFAREKQGHNRVREREDPFEMSFEVPAIPPTPPQETQESPLETSFQDMRAVLEKQNYVNHIAKTRKQAMETERTEARRHRSTTSHRDSLRKQSEKLSTSLLKSQEALLSERKINEGLHKVEQGKKNASKERELRREQAASKRKQREREESLRYVEALEHRLQELVKSQKGNDINLPALCSCHSMAPSDRTNAQTSLPPWDRCANNCQFYRNPHAYAKSLSDLFQTIKLK